MAHAQETRLPRRTFAVPRSRGLVTGAGLLLLGLWGALMPFIGPYFDFGYGSDETWHWTGPHFWLGLLPGAVVAVGGLLLLQAGNRITGSLGGWLAAAGGAWFIVGPILVDLNSAGYVGAPIGGNTRAHLEGLALFYGLGGAVMFLAALAIGRLSVVGVRDLETAAARRDRRAEQEALAAQEAREAQAAQQPEPVPAGSFEPLTGVYPADPETRPVRAPEPVSAGGSTMTAAQPLPQPAAPVTGTSRRLTARRSTPPDEAPGAEAGSPS